MAEYTREAFGIRDRDGRYVEFKDAEVRAKLNELIATANTSLSTANAAANTAEEAATEATNAAEYMRTEVAAMREITSQAASDAAAAVTSSAAAQAAAEQARDENAQTVGEATETAIAEAQAAANAAVTSAETHAQAAAASAQTAATSESNAAASVSAAEASAQAAANSAQDAEDSVETIRTIKTETETARDQAANSAADAGNSASAASGSAQNAQTSATSASGSATAASQSASAAQVSASNAATSAQSAGTSETNAAASDASATAALTEIRQIQQSIPADYTTLSNDVTELKNDLTELEQKGYPMASITEAVDVWADDHESEIVNDYVTPEMYGAKGDGITDDTQAIQNAIDNSRYVKFQKKTYKTGKVILSHSDQMIDFNNSDIICVDDTFLECEGDFDTTLFIGSYTAGTNTGITGLSSYTGLISIDSTYNVMPGRAYYYGGSTIKCNSGVLETPLPYSIPSCTIYGQSTPVNNITIKNISSITGGTSSTAGLIHLKGVSDVVIDNVNFTSKQHYGILVESCSNVLVCNCDISVDCTLQCYGICVYDGCSFVTVRDCHIMSNIWHCVTTGGHRTNLYTTVLNSSMALIQTSTQFNAYFDHGNTIGTRISNCVVTQSLTISDGSVQNCEFIHDPNSNKHVQVALNAWIGSDYNSSFLVRNCRTGYQRMQFPIGFDIQSPAQGTSNQTVVVKDITIADCLSGTYTELTFSSSSVSSIITDFSITDINVSGVNQFDFNLGKYAEHSYISDCNLHTFLAVFSNYDSKFSKSAEVHLTNCIIDANMTANATIQSLFMDNCRVIKSGPKVFYVSDICFINNTYLNGNLDLANLVNSCLYRFSGKANNLSDLYKDASTDTYYVKAKPYDSWANSL